MSEIKELKLYSMFLQILTEDMLDSHLDYLNQQDDIEELFYIFSCDWISSSYVTENREKANESLSNITNLILQLSGIQLFDLVDRLKEKGLINKLEQAIGNDIQRFFDLFELHQMPELVPSLFYFFHFLDKPMQENLVGLMADLKIEVFIAKPKIAALYRLTIEKHFQELFKSFDSLLEVENLLAIKRLGQISANNDDISVDYVLESELDRILNAIKDNNISLRELNMQISLKPILVTEIAKNFDNFSKNMQNILIEHVFEPLQGLTIGDFAVELIKSQSDLVEFKPLETEVKQGIGFDISPEVSQSLHVRTPQLKSLKQQGSVDELKAVINDSLKTLTKEIKDQFFDKSNFQGQNISIAKTNRKVTKPINMPKKTNEAKDPKASVPDFGFYRRMQEKKNKND